ncbi:unnamed protein product [Hymenolepis diminuta]|uniref:t-SNARE coiled-coil homology domain-containing protein n=1 Tax=Hymenolepis diminuta TaxID=6216 RepID=A0A0R3SD83_HYMDI|nr:unnamed protein product [Hymenolepis diminuta]VUZ46029.1 unnamed protein product [Hymenolepis diminuta]
MIEQNLDITLRDVDDECRRMNIVLDDTAVIQQKVREHDDSRKSIGRENISDGKPHHHVCYAAECTIVEILLTEIKFVMLVKGT